MKTFSDLPIFSGGFRPFFWGALIYFIFLILFFTLAFAGLVPTTNIRWDIINWHRHEMIFGYTAAIIAGFLLTAVPNWTKIPTPKGIALAALFCIWIFGRLAMLFSGFLPVALVAIIDIPFYLLIGMAILPSLIKSNNSRNYFFLLLLTIQTIANAIMHFGDPLLGMRLSLNIIILIMLIIGGRVIPFFTESATGVKIFRNPIIEKTAMICAIIAAVLDVWRFEPIISAISLLLAAFANLWRFSQWKTKITFENPLLWILHFGYLWLVIGMFLKAGDLFGLNFPNAIANHAFTTGGIGCLTIGMIARVSLGHTGRPLKADKTIAIAFILVNLAAILRVFFVWAFGLYAVQIYLLSAGILAIAFLIMLVKFFPILIGERHI